ncbi:MAG: tetratricopeptide repeat protein [Anaerolineales bacterium]|nr:tetratricopeptide repeat protein [Anaerolineales bacterium]MDW8227202.1 tetratricopeptide repeat protein [Anaerolineales bacterium]
MNISPLLRGFLLAVLLTSCVPIPAPSPSETASPSSPPSLPPSPATATYTQILSPTPSPTPEARLASGEQALFYGDYETAYLQFQAAHQSTDNPEIQAAALWGLGRVSKASKNYGQALSLFNHLIIHHPDSPYRPWAHFLRGQILAEIGRYAEAVEAYSSYLYYRPGILDHYVLTQRGRAYANLKNYADAIADFQAALEKPHIGDDTPLRIELARTYEQAGDATTALGMYNAIAESSTSDYVKAQMDLLAGMLHMKLGQTQEAYARYQHAVDNYPLAYDSYTALVELVNAGIPVNELHRGLVNYFAGQYGYALAAFGRYLAANPNHDGTVEYYRALTLRQMGEYQSAVDVFTLFINQYPNNRYWDAAWDEKAYTQWAYLNQYPEAAQTLIEYTRRKSDPNLSPQALFKAGRIYERAGLLDQAAQTWDSIAEAYPSSEVVPDAVFFAGILRYRAGQYEAALLSFQRSQLLAIETEQQARALFWAGKTYEKLGLPAEAKTAYQQAASIDPTDYYSLRAQDMLFGRPPFESPTFPLFTHDLVARRAEADAWVRLTFNLPPETDLSGPGTLITDSRFTRGTEFWALGLVEEAQREFESLREAVQDNAEASYRLGNYLLELRLYRPAIFALRRVLTLAGLTDQNDTLVAPLYFNLVRYGLYYADLVQPTAEAHGFHPLFLFSVMRQESLFESFIRSPAGARGLMQIMPTTGEEIVRSYGWPLNYTVEDLYRPIVSIRLGTYYLANRRDYFGGDLYAALAAYNAGIGNANIWRELSGPDPDLFVETIRFAETRNYIRSIYEIYWMYRRFYAPAP